MADDFYPFVDSGDPAPDNTHLLTTESPGSPSLPETGTEAGEAVRYATRIAVYDDMLSTPRIIVIAPRDVRAYLEEITNTVYRCMKEQGGRISLMVIREIVENFIHAHFVEPIISVLDGGNTVRFADQGPGIRDKERAFEFGVTSADRGKKRYIRGTGAGFPMVQQYLENAGGAVSIEDNLGQGTVVTVTVDEKRTREVEAAVQRGAAVRGALTPAAAPPIEASVPGTASPVGGAGMPLGAAGPYAAAVNPYGAPSSSWAAQQGAPAAAYPQEVAPYPNAAWVPQQMRQAQQMAHGAPYPGTAPYPGPAQAPAAWAYQPGAGATSTPAGWPAGAVGWPAVSAPGASGAPASPVAPAPAAPHVTDRGRQALALLAERGTCGPTDLAAAFGASNATWSRELEALTLAGLVTKVGQKRVLTDMGRLWIQQNATQQ
ncbi:MAG: ATP-binding protein [Coriobacteriaceae bacterium]|nr:ATP-binding protein [Coriobacteriaceae bacterium]